MRRARALLGDFPLGISNVLDVGGRDLGSQSRSYRKVFADAAKYDVADVKHGGNVTVPMWAPYCIPVADGSYDLVISGQTLEHVAQPLRLVLEMRRVLRPGGFMVLIVPSAGPAHDERDYWRFQRDAHYAIADECGLRLVSTWIYTGDSGGGRGRLWDDNTGVFQRP